MSRNCLTLVIVLIAAQAHAATISLVDPSITVMPGHLVVVPSFARNGPTQWAVRDGLYAEHFSGNPYAEYDWLELDYKNFTPGQAPTWGPQHNFAVPIDGTQVVQLSHGDRWVPFHVWVNAFIAAGDETIQLILPERPYETPFTWISPHLGTVVMVPEPAAVLLLLGAVVSLRRRSRYVLALAVLLIASTSNAALVSLVGHDTTQRDGHLVIVTSFAENRPSAWAVRDGANAASENPWTNYDWLSLEYFNATPGQPSTWMPASNIAVPIDGTQVIQLHGGGVSNLEPLHIWVNAFIAAGDMSVQLILPSVKPYTNLVFISPHLGTVTLTPEPATSLLALCGLLALRRLRSHGDRSALVSVDPVRPFHAAAL